MKKAKLIDTLSIPMLILGIALCSAPYIALIRAAIGIDEKVQMSFSTTLIFLIGGYMAALSGMIYLSRKSQQKISTTDSETPRKSALKKPHYLGLLMLIPLPFISFILVYLCWQREGQHSHRLDAEYRKSLNFQITIHLYWLLSFFLMAVFIGFIMFAMALLLHVLATLFMIMKTPSSDTASINYPANIKII